MCDKCTIALWEYQDEYNQSMREGVQGYSFSENEAKKEYGQAVRNCKDKKQELSLLEIIRIKNKETR